MKKIKTFALFILLALCVTIPVAVASADEVAATSIVGHNLALEDNIEIVYIVEETAPQGAETGVLFWLSPQEEYVYGEQEYKITTPFGTVVNPNTGNTCQKYAFNYLSAKQMTENVYAVSFIKDGENITYSGVDKYSILQYAYNKKNSATILDGGTASLGEMLSAMLDYGAITQQYFGYNLDRLANATYYRVSVENGKLPDGFTSGLYKSGTDVTLVANAPAEDKVFQKWVDGENNILGTESTLTYNLDKDITITAVYDDFEEEEEITEPTFIVETVSATAGQTGVAVTISLRNNPGIASIALEIYYDEGITLTGFTYNGSIGGQSTGYNASANPPTLSWINFNQNVEGDWVFATLYFNVAPNANGKKAITITYDENNVFDYDEENVYFDIKNGSIEIA